MTDNDRLTPKQEAFAAAYVELGNASEAYRRSYNVRAGTKAPRGAVDIDRAIGPFVRVTVHPCS